MYTQLYPLLRAQFPDLLIGIIYTGYHLPYATSSLTTNFFPGPSVLRPADTLFCDWIGRDVYLAGYTSGNRYPYSASPKTNPHDADMADYAGIGWGWTEFGDSATNTVTSQAVMTAAISSDTSIGGDSANSMQAVYAQRITNKLTCVPPMWFEDANEDYPAHANVISAASQAALNPDYRISLLKALASTVASASLPVPGGGGAPGGGGGAVTADIEGTPTSGGSYSFTLQATDSNGATATKAFTIAVTATAVAITTTSLAPAVVGVPYRATVSATGSGPFTWSLLSGTPPSGFTFDTTATGSSTTITSTNPGSVTSSTFTVKVVDNTGSSATRVLTLAVEAAFPSSPLGPHCSLFLGGMWTDITAFAVQPGAAQPGATITNGRPDETTTQATPATAAFQLNNRDGRFSPRNPTGPYYGLLNRNTPVRWSVASPVTYLRLEDDTSSMAFTGGGGSLDIPTSLEARIDLTLTSYTPGVLAAAGTAVAEELALNGDGTVTWSWTDSSNTGWQATSTAPLPDLGRICIRAKLNTSTGAVSFNTASSMATIGSGPALGASLNPTGGATSVISSSLDVAVGNLGPDLSPVSTGVSGQVWEFKLFNGIAGTVVADPVFSAQPQGHDIIPRRPWQPCVESTTAAPRSAPATTATTCETAALPMTWDPEQHRHSWSPITAAGVLRRLGQGGGGAGQAGGAPRPSRRCATRDPGAGPLSRPGRGRAGRRRGRPVVHADAGGLPPKWRTAPAARPSRRRSAALARHSPRACRLASDSSFACSAPLPGAGAAPRSTPPFPRTSATGPL